MATLVSERSRLLIRVMLTDEVIAAKVLENLNDKEKYKICDVQDTGSVVLGKTSCVWWNKLLNCQDIIPFESFALKVWDALVDMSSGLNNEAIQYGLSQEIIQKSIRRKEYDNIIQRLCDCFSHVAQKSSGYSEPHVPSSAESQHMVEIVRQQPEKQQIVINVNGEPHYIPFVDSVGDPLHLKMKIGIVGVEKY